MTDLVWLVKFQLKDRIAPVTVGHIPRELSRHTRYAIQEGKQFEATVHNTKARPSPSVQGEVEVPIRVWPLVDKLSIYNI